MKTIKKQDTAETAVKKSPKRQPKVQPAQTDNEPQPEDLQEPEKQLTVVDEAEKQLTVVTERGKRNVLLLFLPDEKHYNDAVTLAQLIKFARKHKQEKFFYRLYKMNTEDHSRLIRLFTKIFGVYPRGYSDRLGMYFTVVDSEKAKQYGCSAFDERMKEESHRNAA